MNTKRVPICPKEKRDKINPENIDLLNDFCLYLETMQRSPGTIDGYRGDLYIVFAYILDHCGNKRYVDISKREIIRFQNWLIQNNSNSPARVRRIKSSMSSLSNYIEFVLDEEDEYKGYKSVVIHLVI